MPPKRRRATSAGPSEEILTRSSKKKPATRRRRRPRQQPGPNTNNTMPDPARPEPPPPPPPSLVRLIQKDEAVLEYFQALQSNLDYDVQKWKTRARTYEKERDELQKDLLLLKTTPTTTTTTTRNTTTQPTREVVRNPNNDDDDDGDDDENSIPVDSNVHNFSRKEEKEPSTKEVLPTENKQDDNNAAAADDDDFVLEFSSSSSEDEDVDKAPMAPRNPAPNQSSFGIHRINTHGGAAAAAALATTNVSSSFALNLSSSYDDSSDEHVDERTTSREAAAVSNPSEPSSNWISLLSPDLQLAMHKLQDTHDTLQELGISLIEREEIPTTVNPETNDCPVAQDSSTTALPKAVVGGPVNSHNDNQEGENQELGQRDIILESAQSPNDAGVSLSVRYILRRRSDQMIAIDILQFIKALTRIKYSTSFGSNKNNSENQDNDDTLTEQQQRPQRYSTYFPFMTSNFSPCYSRPSEISKDGATAAQHPAVDGIEKLLSCLCYMDVFCPAIEQLPNKLLFLSKGDTLEQEYKKEDIDKNLGRSPVELQESTFQQLVFAMRNRKRLVVNLLLSLEGEMVDTWAIQDRATRLLTTATHLITSTMASQSPMGVAMEDHAGKAITQPPPSSTNSNEMMPFGSKNLLRLAALVERCIYAKIVTTLYLFRQDHVKAFQVLWSYTLSSVPSLAMEDHPKLPPVLSFCLLEEMLTVSIPNSTAASNASRSAPLSPLIDWMSLTTVLQSSALERILQLALKSTADVYTARNDADHDDRISDVSKVELAAYERLCRQVSWLTPDHRVRAEDARDALEEQINRLLAKSAGGKNFIASLSLAMVVHGDAKLVDQTFQNALAGLQQNVANADLVQACRERLIACGAAKRELELRQLDDYRRVVNSPMHFTPNTTGDQCILSYSRTWIGWLVQQGFESVANMLVSAVRCCITCGDGESMFCLARWIILSMQEQSSATTTDYELLDAMEAASNSIIIRVINLQRRPDRMASFLTQALAERMVFFKGVASVVWRDSSVDHVGSEGFFGEYALDGRGKAADVERRLLRWVGGKQDVLNGLVETHWVPNELKPFDSEAPDHENMVLISPSEKACALSHIACWKGIERSLSLDAFGSLRSIFRDPKLLQTRFLVSGYARGQSLFPANDDMEPAPVCVVMEDDAILVDRFSDRLSSLLDELPRDFHFCSLGYSRPKTAPLVPFSEQLAIPTSIWYLTGYVLSLEGARYLLNRLPVRGPVDSWIGLAMFTNNWDNVFGHALGVGVSSKPPQDPSITKENLRKILRFRAFAAAVPLCNQKVGTTVSNVPSTGRSWRQRDTDIVYSGNR